MATSTNAAGRRKVVYSHIIVFDFTPIPPYQHVSCMPVSNCGLDMETASDLKLTRAFRLTHRRLDIYENQHTYLIIAKTDSDCDHVDRARAVSLLNDFVYSRLKVGVRIDIVGVELVDTFDSRVIKLVPYVAKGDKMPPPRPVKSLRKRPVISSDADDSPGFPGILRHPPYKRQVTGQGTNTQNVTVDVCNNEAIPDGARVIAAEAANTVTMNKALSPTFVETPVVNADARPASAMDSLQAVINEPEMAGRNDDEVPAGVPTTDSQKIATPNRSKRAGQ